MRSKISNNNKNENKKVDHFKLTKKKPFFFKFYYILIKSLK